MLSVCVTLCYQNKNSKLLFFLSPQHQTNIRVSLNLTTRAIRFFEKTILLYVFNNSIPFWVFVSQFFLLYYSKSLHIQRGIWLLFSHLKKQLYKINTYDEILPCNSIRASFMCGRDFQTQEMTPEKKMLKS